MDMQHSASTFPQTVGGLSGKWNAEWPRGKQWGGSVESEMQNEVMKGPVSETTLADDGFYFRIIDDLILVGALGLS